MASIELKCVLEFSDLCTQTYPLLGVAEFSGRSLQRAPFIGATDAPCFLVTYIFFFGTPRKIHCFTPILSLSQSMDIIAPNLCMKQVSHWNDNSPIYLLSQHHSEIGVHYVPSSRIVERSPSSLPVRLFLITSVPHLTVVYSTPKIHHGGSSAPHAVQVPNGLYASSGTSTPGVSIAPQEIYNGGYTNAKDVRLRIANGGAGQSGLIRAWADAFIRFMVKVRHVQPFLVSTCFSARGDITKTLLYPKVAWYLGDTTESLGLLAAGSVDVAVTYNEAAEKQSKDSGAAVALVYGFRVSFTSSCQ
jgi:hypothetical protein